jgi:hypothetical protein
MAAGLNTQDNYMTGSTTMKRKVAKPTVPKQPAIDKATDIDSIPLSEVIFATFLARLSALPRGTPLTFSDIFSTSLWLFLSARQRHFAAGFLHYLALGHVYFVPEEGGSGLNQTYSMHDRPGPVDVINPSLSKVFLTGDGKYVDGILYQRAKQDLQARIPSLPIDGVFSAKQLCSPEFWNSLNVGQRRTVGRCLSHFVAAKELSLQAALVNRRGHQTYSRA